MDAERTGSAVTTVEQLAEQLRARLNTSTADAARRHLFDALVSAAIGTSTPEAARVSSAMAARAGRPGLDLSWLGLPMLGLADGASALARLIRTTEIDDLQLAACVTPAAVVVPAVLAAAEVAVRCDADQLLSGIAVGYDTVYRLGRALGGPDHLFDGGWPTLAVAAAGAATAANVVLGGATDDALAHALALGLADAPRTRPRVEPARLFALGSAVASGIEAALAVQAGTRGDLDVLEEMAARGASVFDLDALAADQAPSGLDATSFKRFCAAGQAAGAIEAAGRLLVQMGVGVSEVERVEVEVPPPYAGMINQPRADERIPSMLSAQHGIALRLVQPDALYDCGRQDRATPRVRAARDLVRIQAAGDLMVGYPRRWPARVRVTTVDGRSAALESDGPATHASWEDLEEKALRFAAANGVRSDFVSLSKIVASFRSVDELLVGLKRCVFVPASEASSASSDSPAVLVDRQQQGPVRGIRRARAAR